MPQSTLFNPTTGKRTAVESGSSQAQSLFSQGYFLETSYNPTTGESTFDDPKQTAQNRSMSSLANMLPPAEDEVDVGNTTPSLIDTNGQQSIMGQFLQDTKNSVLTQTENAIQNTLARMEQDRMSREAEAKTNLDSAAINLENVQKGESLEDMQRRLMKEFELDDKRDKLEKYKNELVALDEQYKMADLAISNKPINAAIVRGQRALKQQEYAAKATTVQAKVAIVGEQYNLAADAVKNLYEAAATDRANTISYYERLYDLERQNLIQLDAEEKDNISASISLIQTADQRATANKDKVVALFEDPVMAKAFQQSGADLSMDFDKVMMQMLPFINDENKRLEILSMSKKSGDGSETKLYVSELDKVVKEYAAQAISLEKYGTQAEKDAAFANLVNQLVKDSGSSMNYSTAQTALIQAMQSQKGETVTYQPPISQSNGSDLEETISSPNSNNVGFTEIEKKKNKAKELVQIASGLTGASAEEIRKAQRELRIIPHFINNEKIW